MQSIKDFKVKQEFEFYKQYYMVYCKKTNMPKLKVIDLNNLSIHEKKEKIKSFIKDLFGYVPLELSFCAVNHYSNKKPNKLMVNISWLNRQRAFEDDDNKFPIGYLLKACINEVFGKTSKNNQNLLPQSNSENL